MPFLLTYEQWLEIWLESGRWGERGSRPDQYVMHRVGDRGAYEKGNVYIDTNARNMVVANTTRVAPGGPMYKGEPGEDVPF